MSRRRVYLRALRNSFLQCYCWMLIFGVIYVLSIGPMYQKWYEARYLGGAPELILFYYPLTRACEVFGPVDEWVQWYVGIWT